jgi:dUTP pyrophosphatase
MIADNRTLSSSSMQIEVRILDRRIVDWGFPSYGSELAAGMDLFACLESELILSPRKAPALISTGMAIHIADPHWCALIIPRSGYGHSRGLVLGNTLGLIDADYTGECFISAWNRNDAADASGTPGDVISIKPGDRIAQMLVVPVARPSWRVVDSFSQFSARGASGFGSTNS